MIDLLNEIIENITNKYKKEIKEIILYGSYAKGTQKEDSDIDILVLFKNKLSTIPDMLFAGDLYDMFKDKYNKKIHVVFEKYYFYVNKCEDFYKDVPNYGKILYQEKLKL